MKLYLSSYHLGDNPRLLLDLVGKNKKAAIIPNSRDMWEDSQRKKEGIDREIQDLKELCLEPTIFDLKRYFGKQEKLKEDISRYGLLWVIGGNTFILRKAMKKSGLDDWLLTQKNNKHLVYAGYSAGVCVLSPSLRGLEFVDNPTTRAEGYGNGVIWEGLGIIDWAFAPHYKSDHPESQMVDKEVAYYKKKKVPYKTLHDGEVIIV